MISLQNHTTLFRPWKTGMTPEHTVALKKKKEKKIVDMISQHIPGYMIGPVVPIITDYI